MSLFRTLRSCIRPAIILVVVVAFGSALLGQAPRPGVLRGQVTDISGGSVEGATVLLTTPTGQTLARTTDATGAFEIPDLAPGNYNLSVTMAGFGPSEQGVQIVTVNNQVIMQINLVSQAFFLLSVQGMVLDHQMVISDNLFALKIQTCHISYPILYLSQVYTV